MKRLWRSKILALNFDVILSYIKQVQTLLQFDINGFTEVSWFSDTV